MLTAAVLHNGKPFLYNMIELKEKNTSAAEIRSKSWICPHCSAPMLPKVGPVRAWHFAHQSGESDCPALRELELPETVEHIEMKKALATKLQMLYGKGKIQFEAALPEAGRIADVLLTLEDGSRIAGEAQRSPITFEKLQMRTNSYLDAGIDVIWAFDDAKATRDGSAWAGLRDWLLEQGLPVMLATVEYREQLI